MGLIERGSAVDATSKRERALSKIIFEEITQSADEFRLSQSRKSEVLDLISRIGEARVAAQTTAEYKWCVDTLEKWRYFLVSNGEYVPRPETVTPHFLANYILDLASSDEAAKISRGDGRIIEGVALKDSFDKTAKISVAQRRRDSLTGKTVRSSKTYLVHDEFNRVSEGDWVRAKECRPVSKNKHFALVDSRGATDKGKSRSSGRTKRWYRTVSES